MSVSNKREALLLFVGDLFFLYFSLILTLIVRYGRFPDDALLGSHLHPFSILFLVWLLVFFIAGLYEKHTLLFKSKLPSSIFSTQVINVVIAIFFFYLTPFFEIAPKTNLFIYLFISAPFIIYWRNIAAIHLSSGNRIKALLIGEGEEAGELYDEVNNNHRYPFEFVGRFDLKDAVPKEFHQEILNYVYEHEISTVIIDIHHYKVTDVVPRLYNLIFSKIEFLDMHRVYEEVFDRVPLSLIRHNWFLEHLSMTPRATYSTAKRVMDIVGAGFLLIIAMGLYPFVWLAIKLDDRGPFLYHTKRVGQDNKIIDLPKIRTMNNLDTGEEALESQGSVTRVGAFLRNTRIDELPQVWSVFKGDLSLIGPRPEIPELANVYEEEVPYYNVRHLIKPGLSGWAQLYQDGHPHHGTDTESTKEKLSYDLYYIKNRSLWLDVKIALKTLKKIVTRSGK